MVGLLSCYQRRQQQNRGACVHLLVYLSEFEGKPQLHPSDWLDEALQLFMRRQVKEWLQGKGYDVVEIANGAQYGKVLQAWVRSLEDSGLARSPDGVRVGSIALKVHVHAAGQRF
ncbi:hypothetical protein TSOC_001544 [Tetrabaena socialis]|uniref:Uncharacterized protein n=1 Tax=Tetrabaena socialis TaxID=47790 RepID=A0A2J8AGJ2_9CHLO|nr:hypothetical protein TSOC_001544 [Tetrabaena socialis]|eukprot:PNH11616.1 hypothetical protein TSOC_001544 [Tetrabaena socialis]